MDLLNGLREKAQQNLEFLGHAGMGVSVVKDDKVIFAGGFGFKDVEQGLKADENTVFPIGSASKAFTSTALMMAQDRKLVDIDAPLRNYMPELVFQDSVANDSVTARDIMCHRTGLPRHDMLWGFRPNISRREMVECIRLLQPSAPFRTKWQYNNLMFTSAGYLLEKVTGTRWEDFVRRDIFAPLKMSTATFNAEDSVIGGNFSLAYNFDRKKCELDQVAFSRVCANGPAGSINASALEMANWVRFNLGQGTFENTEILSKTGFAQLTRPNIPYATMLNEPETRVMGYGLGWFVESYRGKKLVYHGGNVNGSSAVVGFMPEINAGVTVLVNTGGSVLPRATMYDVFDRLLGFADAKDWVKILDGNAQKMILDAEKAEREQDESRKPARTAHDLDEFAGTYKHPAYGTIKVYLEGGELFAKLAEKKCRMENWHFDIFMLHVPVDYREIKTPVEFSTGINGGIDTLQCKLEPTPGVDPIVFVKTGRKG